MLLLMINWQNHRNINILLNFAAVQKKYIYCINLYVMIILYSCTILNEKFIYLPIFTLFFINSFYLEKLLGIILIILCLNVI